MMRARCCTGCAGWTATVADVPQAAADAAAQAVPYVNRDAMRRILEAAAPHIAARAAAAERERLSHTTAVQLANEALNTDRLGHMNMTLGEAAGQVGMLVASLRMV